MRSLLFVPAHIKKMYATAQDSEADALIYDLEDSCPGEANHQQGIENIIAFGECGKTTFCRIRNEADIEKVKNYVDAIIYPKAEQVESLIEWSSLTIYALIESALGVLDVSNIARCVDGLIFGNEDYFADTGSKNFSYASDSIVTAAKAYGLPAIDTVHVDVHNLEELEKFCFFAVRRGFDGKLCLHPKEVPIVNRHFTPTEKEYDHAMMVVQLYEEAEQNGRGVAILNGVYVAPPMVKRAKKIIETYEHYVTGRLF